MNIAWKCSPICFEQSCLAWHLSWFLVYWYGLRLVSWEVALGYFSRLRSRSCSTWLTLSSTRSILLQRSRRWSLQAWNWWATKDNMSFLKKMNLFTLYLKPWKFFYFGLHTLGKKNWHFLISFELLPLTTCLSKERVSHKNCKSLIKTG